MVRIDNMCRLALAKGKSIVNAVLWVVLNLLFSPVGFIGHLVARREETSN